MLGQQLVYLRVLRRFGDGENKLGLIAADLALVTSMTLAMVTSPNLVAAAFAAEMLCVNHKDPYGHHPFLNNRPKYD